MKHPVIALGLDATNSQLIETWMERGHLPHLSRLREAGVYTPLRTTDYANAKTPHYRAETAWTTFLTGCSPQSTGFWGQVKYDEKSYNAYEEEDCKGGAYSFQEYPPFYALGDRYKVAIFDVPQSIIADDVRGVQVLAWGAHAPMAESQSKPAELFQELVEKHGKHPTLYKDHAECLSWESINRLKQGLLTGIERRAAICRDLLQRERWDLLMTVFGEAHSAEHFMWHLSQSDHPLHGQIQDPTGDSMLEVFQAIDRAIGDIVAAAPEDANIVIFAAHSMAANTMDLPSTVFLPELLYRFSFPGKQGLAPGRAGSKPGKPLVNFRKRGWSGEIWSLRYDANPLRGFLRRKAPTRVYRRLQPWLGEPEDGLASPYELKAEGDTLHWQPTRWYKRLWPKMKAFALPGYSEGFIRINLQGREPEGIVAPEDYDALCEEIAQMLYRLKDARTGKPMVREIIRTRQSASDRNPKLPTADLVVMWQDEQPTDTVDSPDLGRVGPIPHGRTGSHRSGGFFLAKGPNLTPGTELPVGQPLDLPPTILALMDAPIPEHLEGQSLVEVETPTLA